MVYGGKSEAMKVVERIKDPLGIPTMTVPGVVPTCGNVLVNPTPLLGKKVVILCVFAGTITITVPGAVPLGCTVVVVVVVTVAVGLPKTVVVRSLSVTPMMTVPGLPPEPGIVEVKTGLPGPRYVVDVTNPPPGGLRKSAMMRCISKDQTHLVLVIVSITVIDLVVMIVVGTAVIGMVTPSVTVIVVVCDAVIDITIGVIFVTVVTSTFSTHCVVAAWPCPHHSRAAIPMRRKAILSRRRD